MLLRGHNCVWYNQLPSWVANGKFTTADLTTVIQTHCSTLVSHYKGQVYVITFYALTLLILTLFSAVVRLRLHLLILYAY